MQFSISKVSRQAGLTLLEVLVSLGILATVMTGIVALSNQQNEKTKASVVALHARLVGTAASEYIKDNYSLLLSTATVTQPALIRVSDLVAAGKLQAGFNSLNARGQDTCVLVLKQSATNLTSILVTEGGETIDDLTLGQVASEIGAAGGGIYSTAPGNMRGSMGGWDTPIGSFANPNHLGQRCSGAGGNIVFAQGHPVMALWFADSQDVAATLYRDGVPGNPSLNTMNTPIIMGSVQTLNGACSSTGAIARDAGGALLSCQGGVWKSPGDGKCVSTDADLNSLQTDGRCYNSAGNPNSPAGGDWFFLEVFRHVNQGNYYVSQRVIGMTGWAVGKVWLRNQQSGTQAGGWSAWNQVSDPGVTTANSTLTANRVQSAAGAVGGAGQLFYDVAGSMMAANTSIYSYGKICAGNSSGGCDGTGGVVLSSNGTIGASGNIAGQNITASQADVNGTGFIRPGWAVETWGCASNGDIAKAAYTVADGWAYNGKTLSCQSGVWRIPAASFDANQEYGLTQAGRGQSAINIGSHKACFLSRFYVAGGQESSDKWCQVYPENNYWVLLASLGWDTPSVYKTICYARCID
ncbi:shufflon system plasmid conjugative transfer pilus tip adhesin PilV [Diaphorobacter sp. LR2014-1]|uniref:shufflon system plasmid conjugative transfer pilus tip adhesin PilV n=1 Tax=Diaphorobacter sp. LR2014-1 TaxID=1933219 RepID=UPI000CDAC2EB|nr:shufflon system plasmid conjugative transfer pilus tip adhesin PilV [Diaphorobacter sp. LR2014-1]